MKQIRLPKPGDRYVSADVFLALYQELVRTGKIEGAGLAVDSGAGGIHLSAPPPRPTLWAVITGEPTPGRYSWEEVERTDLDTFEVLEFGRTDEDMNQPAIEVNKTVGIAVDTYVFLELGFGRPVSQGVEQEWIFRHGGGGGGRREGFWCRIASMDCRNATYSLVEQEMRPNGGFSDLPGGISSSLVYHATKQNYLEGPLVEPGTICWARYGNPGPDPPDTQEYLIDCPAGFTGTRQFIVDWVCENGVPIKTMFYFHWRNGQLTREPCAGNINVCGPCSTHPFTPFGTFAARVALALATLATGAGALL